MRKSENQARRIPIVRQDAYLARRSEIDGLFNDRLGFSASAFGF